LVRWFVGSLVRWFVRSFVRSFVVVAIRSFGTLRASDGRRPRCFQKILSGVFVLSTTTAAAAAAAMDFRWMGVTDKEDDTGRFSARYADDGWIEKGRSGNDFRTGRCGVMD